LLSEELLAVVDLLDQRVGVPAQLVDVLLEGGAVFAEHLESQFDVGASRARSWAERCRPLIDIPVSFSRSRKSGQSRPADAY
jgi:hypothetical protein